MKLVSSKKSGKHAVSRKGTPKEIRREAPSPAYTDPIEALYKEERRPAPAPAPTPAPASAPAPERAYEPKPSAEKKPEKKKKAKKEKKPKKKGRRLIKWLCVILTLALMYVFVVFTQFAPVKALRDAWIETAMSTMSHQWLAEWFFPQSVIDEVVNRVEQAQDAQKGIISRWKEQHKPQPSEAPEMTDEEKFYALFRELDKTSFEEYLASHPEAKSGGWSRIYVNEAGIDDKGTSIKTVQGDNVLAIDAANKIILIRVKGNSFQGVLAVAKDSSKLSCHAADLSGGYGKHLDEIAEDAGAVLAMNGSGFLDDNGVGSGALLAGYAMTEGTAAGEHSFGSSKRIELHKDDLMYITDADYNVSPDCTDAVEFAPAVFIDGEQLVDINSGWSSINPRACVGQNKYGETMMLVIEGRLVGRSIGCTLPDCAKILAQYDAYQIMQLDGGTSAVMWYKGEYVTKCSNTAIFSRYLPNAWVYKGT